MKRGPIKKPIRIIVSETGLFSDVIFERSPVLWLLREKGAYVDMLPAQLDIFPLPWKFDISSLRSDSIGYKALVLRRAYRSKAISNPRRGYIEKPTGLYIEGAAKKLIRVS